MELDFTKDIIVTFDNILIDMRTYENFGEKELKIAIKKLVHLANEPENEGYKIIQMNQVNHIDLPFENGLASKFFLRNDKGDILTEDLEVDILSIEEARNCRDENNKLAKWLRFIGASTEEERLKIANGEDIFLEMNNAINKIIDSKNIKAKKKER